jgi:two-component system KDP operon response regulator KdpE
MSVPSILIIDDDHQILNVLTIILQSNNYHVETASTGQEGLNKSNKNPNLILLDLGLPDRSGHEILIELRKWFINPVIVLSAQSSEPNIVKSLDNGANDFIMKPFRTADLLNRIKTGVDKMNIPMGRDYILSPDLFIDLNAQIVKRNNAQVKLTNTEQKLISLFIQNEGKILTHHYLSTKLWGSLHENESQYLRVSVAQLRKKIEKDPNRPEHIITESGIGYRFIGKAK